MSPGLFFKSSSYMYGTAVAAFAIAVAFSSPAKADISSWGAGRVLQEALSTNNHMDIYNDNRLKGFSLSGSTFSGYASGIDAPVNNYLGNDGSPYGNMAQLAGEQRVYAMMVDGNYQFDNDLGTGLALHPYMSSGFGMAVYDSSGAMMAANLTSQGGDMVPLFRVGGGVAYKLSETLNMSVDYKVGFSGSDSYLAARGISNADMQTINMGMHYRF